MSARTFKILAIAGFALIWLCFWVMELVGYWILVPQFLVTLGVLGLLAEETIRVKRSLRARGYDWVGIIDAIIYLQRQDTRTRHVPPHDEMRMIPGFVEEDMDSLCDCLDRPFPGGARDQ